jgi:hypothetical protein
MAAIARWVVLGVVVAQGPSMARAAEQAAGGRPLAAARAGDDRAAKGEHPSLRASVVRLLDESLRLLIRVHSGEALPPTSPEFKEASALVSQARLELYDATRKDQTAARRHLAKAERMMGRLRELVDPPRGSGD